MSTTPQGLAADLTPSAQLAKQIADLVIAKGFSAEDKRDSIEAKVATGQMKAEDWRTLVAGSLRSNETDQGADA